MCAIEEEKTGTTDDCSRWRLIANLMKKGSEYVKLPEKLGNK